MNDSLIPERPIVVSPTLAASIGLEEAILLQHLQGLQDICGQPREQFLWISCSLQSLSTQLPFWPPASIRRILQQLMDLGLVLVSSFPVQDQQSIELAINQQQSVAAPERTTATKQESLGAHRIPADWRPDANLLEQLQHNGVERTFALGQVAEFVMYWQDRGESQHSWSSKFLKHVTQRWQREQNYRAGEKKREQTSTTMEKRWQPNIDAVEILERMGINRNFIDDAIPEFVLYWQERGEAQNTWNSKFVTHVKRQWARFTNTLKHDTEPRRIQANWQPDPEVYEVLTIANIDEQFARSLVAEFVMFWRDRKDLHHSWNTKFLQHVKFHWARRNQNAAGQASKADVFERLTDRSWAADLV